MKSIRLLIIVCLWASVSQAQFSPGALVSVHAQLSGATRCGSCHDFDDPAGMSRLCLDCHSPIRSLIDSSQGFHGRQEHTECVHCHPDHLGPEYLNVQRWSQEKGVFDHRRTGYDLTGKHVDTACRDCHREAKIQLSEGVETFLNTQVIDREAFFAKTWLGLGTACISCHEDIHRRQFKASCESCHDTGSWKSSGRSYDHSRSRFKLRGKHESVGCEKCHKVQMDGALEGAVLFKPFPSIRCVSCHEDVHRGKLGTICEDCHNESNWKQTRRERFSHDQTGYILKGAHAAVECKLCHKAGEAEYRPRHENCYDCHEDIHRGEFRAEPWLNRCQSCHGEQRWIPALYGLREHSRSVYPLTGAHRATPCTACHKTAGSWVFRLQEKKCLNCHATPHPRGFERFGSCESCHGTESWRTENFDHSRSGYDLEGKHQSLRCVQCHTKMETVTGSAGMTSAGPDSGQRETDLSVKGTLCENCHEDEHAGQFTLAGNRIFCERCHGASTWRITNFDHNVQSNYRLDDTHQKVPCGKCHLSSTAGAGRSVLQYRGTPERCEDCHKVSGYETKG